MPVSLSQEERALLGHAKTAELDAAHDELEAQLKAHRTEVTALKKSLRDREAELTSERAGRAKAISEATAAHREAVQRAQVTDAPVRAGVNPAALKHAIAVMLNEAKFDVRDDGTIKSTTIGTETWASLEVAAAKFLVDAPFLHQNYDREQERIVEPDERHPLSSALGVGRIPPPRGAPAHDPASISNPLAFGLAQREAELAAKRPVVRDRLPTQREIESGIDRPEHLILFGMRQRERSASNGGRGAAKRGGTGPGDAA